jgi:hypothetical protein
MLLLAAAGCETAAQPSCRSSTVHGCCINAFQTPALPCLLSAAACWVSFCIALDHRNPANWTQQVCYEESIHFTSMAFLVRNTDPDAGFSWPGYILYMTNTSRVCDYYITNECYSSLGQDTCIADLLNNLLNGTSSGFEWTPGAIAGVAAAGMHPTDRSCL